MHRKNYEDTKRLYMKESGIHAISVFMNSKQKTNSKHISNLNMKV